MLFVSTSSPTPTERRPPPGQPSRPAAPVACRAQWVAITLLVLAGIWPLLGPYFRDLGQRPPYAMYPLVMLAAVALGVSHVREMRTAALRTGGWPMTTLLLGGALGLMLLGSATYVRWLAAPATMLALAGLVWRIGGPALARALLPAGVLLLTIIPPPSRGETTLTVGLQRLSVEASSRLLDVLGILHVRTGNVLSIPSHRLLIEEACSGINSVVAVTAFTLLAGFWRRRPGWWIALLLPIALLFVLGLNVLRIAGGAVLLDRWDVNVFDGAIHDWIGLIIFAGAVGLVLSVDAGIELVRRSGRVAATATTGRAADHPATQRPAGGGVALGWAFAIAFLAIGGWSAWHLRACWPAPRLAADARFSVPTSVGDWSLLPPRADGSDVESTTTTAKHTRHWTYRHATGRTVEVALAYPFTVWFHDPRICYGAAGWRTSSFTPVDPQTSSFRFDMDQLGGRNATVIFADFAERGDVQHPEPEPAGGWLAKRLALTRRVAFYQPTCELQTLATTFDATLSDDERTAMGELFLAVRTSLREQVIEQTGGVR